jgi:hypothetical protein
MDVLSRKFFSPGRTRLSLPSLVSLLLFLLFTLLFSANIAYGFDRSFAWDKNTEPDIAGYYIYYKNGSSGAPYNGTGAEEGNSPIQIPVASLNDPDNPQFTIHGLSGTGTFYFVATTYDTSGNESGYSAELSYQPSVPSANNDSATVAENSGVTSINVISNDNFGGDGPAAEDIRISTGPVHGSAAVNNGNTSDDPTDDSIDYTPDPDFNGTDTLTYEICDSNGDCDTALLTITVTPETPAITLSSLSINGNDSVNESSNADYAATASFSDGSTQTVTTSASWSENSTYAGINSSGKLTTSAVPSDQTVTIQASYTYNGTTRTATKTVTITNVPAPVTLSSLSISGADSINEGGSAAYTATALLSNGSSQTVTSSASWSENSAYANINSSGLLTASQVSGDQTVTVQASYTYSGTTRTATKTVTIIDVPPSNLPPSVPVIVSPVNGQTEVDFPLDITADTFSDPNDDAHSQSQWQISEQSNFATLVFDSVSNTCLTSLPVPQMVLNASHTYYVRVRFYDTYSAASEWSGVIEFTTALSSEDLNSNGIPDANEVSDTTDVNLDGIPDNDQPDIIKSIQTTDGSTYFGIEKNSTAISEIEQLEMVDQNTITDMVNRPDDLIFGLTSFRLRVNQPGATVSVRIYFSGEIFDSDVYYKYDRINGWYDYSDHTIINNDRISVTLELKDGGFGDSDGIANGIIVDPGGIAAVGNSINTASSDGGGSGCFITTAAFGSKFEKHLQLLRRFRDLFLMPHRIGRAFVRAYYRYSPPMADFIAQHDTLRKIVRWSLVPLIGLSWMLLHLGFVPTLLMMVLMISVLWVGYGKMRPTRE